ncbi:MAG: MarC family transcriptional regulator [Deltaproteobacteria bacterium CG11_big_fil_rev_8_21_14_0_20_42_23]|nr:MAG: MarC family transcriptional regulator [Deltaproteobacteria bacterium CG11_big_fil_rev_8_21_14_0_20_42_23]PJC63416.1 MAG: MarC family transcriptional regulator [Deltaproteobacteria bacterium CG_4_9_14_0_2_um_filter_42_21]
MPTITLDEILKNFILLWVVIDPIGTIPVFIEFTKKHADQDTVKIAFQACSYALMILSFFLIAGQFIFESMAIPLAAFQTAGGIILFIFALSMIFGEGKPGREVSLMKSGRETALYPIAMPSLASPGAIVAVMLLTDNHRFSALHQSVTLGIVALVLLLTFLLILVKYIYRIIGDSGASVLSRIMGLILAAIAVNFVLEGVKSYFFI